MSYIAKRPHSAAKLTELRRLVEPALPPSLPGIDPSGVFIEDDADELSSYARGLWQQWQGLSAELAARDARQALLSAYAAARDARRLALAVRRGWQQCRSDDNDAKKEADNAVAEAWHLRAAVRDAEADAARAAEIDRAAPPIREGYTKAMVKAAAARLIAACSDAEVPPPYELSRLIGAILAPDKTARTSPRIQPASDRAYWAAVRLKARQPDAGASRIARYLRSMNLIEDKDGGSDPQKSAEATVKRWLKLSDFQASARLHQAKTAE